MIERHAFLAAHQLDSGALRVGVVVREGDCLVAASCLRASEITLNAALALGVGRAVDIGAVEGAVLVIHLANADVIAALAGDKPCKGPLAAAVAHVAPRLSDFAIPHFDPAPNGWYDRARGLAQGDDA